MTGITRRMALGVAVAVAGLLAVGVAGEQVLRRLLRPAGGMMGGGMMGSATSADMSLYMDLFNRHTELRRTIEEIPGGVRTVTESDQSDLVAQLQAHVSSMYSHLDHAAEVTCMSDSLPTLFRRSREYTRRLQFVANGVVVTETSSDPAVTDAIRRHAREVTGFVRDGMPAMMQGMMGG